MLYPPCPQIKWSGFLSFSNDTNIICVCILTGKQVFDKHGGKLHTQKRPKTCNTTWIHRCNKVRRMSLFAGRVTLHKSGIMEDVYARELSWPKSSAKWTQLLWESALHMYGQDTTTWHTSPSWKQNRRTYIRITRLLCPMWQINQLQIYKNKKAISYFLHPKNTL